MRAITTKELFGHLFNSLVGNLEVITITDNTGNNFIGIVKGHAIGGYSVKGIPVKETVLIYNTEVDELHTINVDEIDSITLPDNSRFG
jgi:hypothetical protein